MIINLTETDRQILKRHSSAVRGRCLIELLVVDALIQASSRAGYSLSIEGEDESPLRAESFYSGTGSWMADAERLKGALFNLDDAVLLVSWNGKGKKAFGWIKLVIGNGCDLVSDHSVNLEPLMAPVQAVADFWGDD